jgi:hypothetical protein
MVMLRVISCVNHSILMTKLACYGEDRILVNGTAFYKQHVRRNYWAFVKILWADGRKDVARS